MISVGIDVSKGKSMVCVMKPYGEIIISPYEMQHTESDLEELSNMISKLDGEVKVIMEATGVYHLPVLMYLQEKRNFVSVINPYQMKEYRNQGLRRVKTDKKDAIAISKYGIDHWFDLRNYEPDSEKYSELKLLGRQYRHIMSMRIEAILGLTHLLDYTMPGIKVLLSGFNEETGKDKLADFVEKYQHFDEITKISEKQFIRSYICWAKKKGYHQSQSKAEKIYALASDGIPTIPSNDTCKVIMLEAVETLRRLNASIMTILTRMTEIAKSLPEYPVVRAMGGVGNKLSVKLIAEIGDVRRFHSGKALIAYAGIDAPPYQSGKFTGTERHISKRGSSNLRKIGYEVMRSLKSHDEPEDKAVYQFILKKEAEGKPKRVAKIAGLNKFLRIYYARVMEIYK